MNVTTGSGLEKYIQNSQNFTKLQLSADPDSLSVNKFNLWVLKGKKLKKYTKRAPLCKINKKEKN